MNNYAKIMRIRFPKNTLDSTVEIVSDLEVEIILNPIQLRNRMIAHAI